MSRWIEVNEFYDKMYEWVRIHGGIIRNEMQAILEATPSIDIVRCKECYMCDEKMWCSFYDSIMESDDFCSYGEREGE